MLQVYHMLHLHQIIFPDILDYFSFKMNANETKI